MEMTDVLIVLTLLFVLYFSTSADYYSNASSSAPTECQAQLNAPDDPAYQDSKLIGLIYPPKLGPQGGNLDYPMKLNGDIKPFCAIYDSGVKDGKELPFLKFVGYHCGKVCN